VTPDPSNAPAHLQGQLLLADPSLREGMFDRSVVLLAEHSVDNGAFGLILNQPTEHVVGDLLHDDQFAPLRQIPVFVGGPVSPEQLTFSAFWWSPKKGLRWEIRMSAEDAIARAHKSGTIVRAFVGYSGWSKGQLEGELRRNSWITAAPDRALLGATHDRALWSGILRGLSPYHRILAEAPKDPFLN
jgi:putative transcriptional regulator